MTLAEDARRAVRERPFLLAALRAGVLNYAAAARHLRVGGDPDAVATALRRYAEELPDFEATDRDARVSMESGLGEASPDEALVSVSGVGYAAGEGSLTGVAATGDVDARALAAVLGRLDAAGVTVEAAGVAGDSLVVVVARRDGANAVRLVESALDAVPASATDG